MHQPAYRDAGEGPEPLRALQLSGTDIDGGLDALAGLAALESLSLEGTDVDGADTEPLPALLPGLQRLDVSSTGVSDELASRLSTDSLDVITEAECSG